MRSSRAPRARPPAAGRRSATSRPGGPRGPSPPASATVLGRMRAPTLLLQGLQDTLFGLDQADANARQLTRAGAPVQVRWFDGGHDGGGTAGTGPVVDAWLAAHLAAHERVPSRFT